MSVQSLLGHNDKAIAKYQYWLQESLGQKITIKTMSPQCALTERTLIRRFKAATDLTPLSYLQQLRVDAAKQLLEKIVTWIGYGDASAFRRLFTKSTQLTPRAYRHSFSNKY
jgi:transcriptional regulator GlxA family with amidase domain